ncbi:MAG: hypothetical protein V4725_02490 [Bacteroidota bacterium]
MEAQPFHQVLQVNDTHYTYFIRPFVLKNGLGFAIALLDEYVVWDASSTFYKLYRTREGNWYDMTDVNPDHSAALVLNLKMAIEEREG